jgi:CRP-like cAMP-binding protein
MAMSQSPDRFANAILNRLSPNHLDDLRHHLKPIELPVRLPIYEPKQTIRYAYFVESGMISVVSVMEDGRSIEVGTIGKEGITGGCLLLGADSVPYRYFVQAAGHAHRVDASVLKTVAEKNALLRDLILRSQAAFQIQTMQAAACNGLHSVQQRCCRWLLMSQDRVDSSKINLTHEFLGLMLGVRRASVTDVLRPLQDRGWVESNRGEISILDREALESGSCECYRIIKEQQQLLLD